MMTSTAAGQPMVKVLLVDDDAGDRQRAAEALADRGYVCFDAANGDEARAVLDAEQDIDAVVCDITSLGEMAKDVLVTLVADFPDLAVVITAAAYTPQIAELAARFGAFGYVIKPFDPDELRINLSSALRRRDLESAHRSQTRSLEHTIARTQTLGVVLERFTNGAVTPPHPDEGDEEIIDRLARAVSLRDEETGRHLQRMSRYAVVLAAAVGYDGMPLDELRLATALHDVGKIGVPDGILLKPGPLSPDEYTSMQRHALMGHRLLAGATSEVVSAAARIALTHHEWWDGRGYPRGLRGEEIPEEGRIAAIADVFDALTSNRVYRPAMSFDKAIDIIQRLSGLQFEPRLLDAFIESMPAIRSIREEYPDLDDAPERIRVLVVDDHQIFVDSLVRLLGSRPGVQVVGTAGTVAGAVMAATAYLPDVILMDFSLPDGDGPHATEQIKALTPAVKVIMLTARTDEHALVSAIAAGCSGFVKKEDTVDRLLDVIVAVHEDETIASPGDLVPLLRQLRPTDRGLGSGVTPRELEILELIRSGLANKEIALRLGLRLNTVRNHVRNTLSKLEAHSKLEAVANAVREGLISYPAEAGSK